MPFSLNVGFHHARSPHISVPIPMGKPPTGEPCAGEPHARFGGRGGATLPDPYHHLSIINFNLLILLHI